MTSATVPRATFEPSATVAGVELGGTKCVLTLARGPDHILAQQTIPTGAPDATLAAIAAILRGWWDGTGFAALGVASFGPIDLDVASHRFGRILATTKVGWQGADVAAALAGPFDVPFALDTDVNAAAMAEIRWGCARGLSDFAYITVGTGVGVGLIVNGRSTRGIGHTELGHLRVPRLPGDVAPSGCVFHDDCIEGLASGTAIKAALGIERFDTLDPTDPIWDRVSDALAKLCHAIVCATGPWRIAIGGGVFTRQPHLLARIEPGLRASLNTYLPLPEGGAYVVAPALGDQAGPLGPIALAYDALARDTARAGIDRISSTG